jgi:menaquinone-dependent protoporphyrinogen oxidase
MKILIAYGTKKGSTKEVALHVAKVLREQGCEPDLLPASQVRDVGSYAAAVLGGSIYSGHLNPDVMALLKRHRREFARLPVAVFGMGPQTMDEREVAGSQRQLDRSLQKARGIRPVSSAIFGGVIDPSKLRFPFNRMPASDARDWEKITAWTESLPARLGLGQVGLTRIGDVGVREDVDERRLA